MKLYIGIFFLVGALAVAVTAGRRAGVTEEARGKDIRTVDARVGLGIGKFELTGKDLPDSVLARFDGEYDRDKYRHELEFEPRGSHATLDFKFENRRNRDGDLKSDDNIWKIDLSPRTEWELALSVGAAELNADLGNVPLSQFSLDVGAADAVIDFSAPNRTLLTDLEINAGACELKVLNLGNARFDVLEFSGGVGDFVLDFSGKFDFEAEANISVGLGSVDIVVPSDIGLRLEADQNWFNSIDFSKRKLRRVSRQDDVYETDNYDSAIGKLSIKLDVGMGSANIDFK